MNMLDAATLEELRDRYRNQATPSELLREIVRLLGARQCHRLDLLANLRAVFALSLAEASPIGGWSPDGTGELKDAQIDGFLIPAIEKNRSRWDLPHKTNA
jgi:hypothetical protein